VIKGREYASLKARLDELTAQGLRRTLRILEPIDATHASFEGRRMTLFCSNDYLGLAHAPELTRAARGGGAGSARLISGNRASHSAIEDRLSALYGRPATLLSSGYHANLALFTTLLKRGMSVASDALNHASIIDGIRLAHATRHIVPHGEPEHLTDVDLVAVEGLYSMDGDTLNLADYTGSHWLAVDEAHAFGCLGPKGKGVAAAQGVQPDFLVGTLGKAIGAYGAFIVGPPELRELLLSQGRSFIFTTGLPETVTRVALTGIERAIDGDDLRKTLAQNAEKLRAGLKALGLCALGEHHIIPVILGERAMPIAEALFDAGFLTTGIRPPTVAKGTERIRFTASAAHSDEDIERLLHSLETILNR